MNKKDLIIIILILLISLDFLVWRVIFKTHLVSNNEIYFLDVGQGDSEFLNFKDGIQILIDAGRGNKILKELSLLLPFYDKYIDLVIVSHPEIDHYGGVVNLLEYFKIGAFIFNGKIPLNSKFESLIEKLKARQIPIITLAKSDKILIGNQAELLVLSPDLQESYPSLNDYSLVLELVVGKVKSLFTGDISSVVEKKLIKDYGLNLDILKVAHHGSRYSSSQEFLQKTTPKISIIEVGENSYGHPHPEVIKRLARVGSRVYTTTQGGVKLSISDKDKIKIFRKI